MVYRVYRRQPLVREVCERIGYQGRYVWLIGQSSVEILATEHLGPSRIRFKALAINGPTRIIPITKRKRGVVAITFGKILVALPTIRNRRRTLLMFVHPMMAQDTGGTKATSTILSPEEVAILLSLDWFKYGAATSAVARAVCFYRGLIRTPTGPISSYGRKILLAYLTARGYETAELA